MIYILIIGFMLLIAVITAGLYDITKQLEEVNSNLKDHTRTIKGLNYQNSRESVLAEMSIEKKITALAKHLKVKV